MKITGNHFWGALVLVVLALGIYAIATLIKADLDEADRKAAHLQEAVNLCIEDREELTRVCYHLLKYNSREDVEAPR